MQHDQSSNRFVANSPEFSSMCYFGLSNLTRGRPHQAIVLFAVDWEKGALTGFVWETALFEGTIVQTHP